MRMRIGVVTALVAAGLLLAAGPASAKTGKGMLYLDDEVVRTVVNPAALPHGGSDPFFVVTNGVGGQLGIAGLGPGDPGYTGGDWAFHTVMFTGDPYLLTSDEAVAAAEAAGDVIVTRIPEMDFRCPVLP